MADQMEIGHSLCSLGNLSRSEGDDTAARPLFVESLAIFRQANNYEALSAVLNNLGAIDCNRGRYETALPYFVEGLSFACEIQDKIGISYFLDGFASVATSVKMARLAARLAGAAESIRGSIGYEPDSVDRRFRDEYLKKLPEMLSDAEIYAELETGRKLTFDDAVNLALDFGSNE